MKKINGFTLIELLVVLFIVGIIVTFAVIAVGSGLRHRDIVNTADELKLIFKFASDEAVLLSTAIAFVPKENGYEFYQYELTAEGNTAWKPLKPDRILGFRKIHEFIHLDLYSQGKKIVPGLEHIIEPKLIFYNDGTITSFYLNIGELNKKPVYQLQGHSASSLNIIDLAGLPS